MEPNQRSLLLAARLESGAVQDGHVAEAHHPAPGPQERAATQLGRQAIESRQKSFPGNPRSWLLILFVLSVSGTATAWVPARWNEALISACVCFLGVLAYWKWSQHRLLFLDPPSLILLGLASWCWVRYLSRWTLDRYATLEEALAWTTHALVFVIGSATLRDRRARHWLCTGLIWFSVFVAVSGLAQYYSAGGHIWWVFPSGYPDNLGFFVNRNHFAAFIELALPLAAARALRGRMWPEATATALLAGSAVASGSRAGAFLTLAELLAVGWLAWRGSTTKGPAGSRLVVLVGLSVLAASAAGTGLLWQRLRSWELTSWRVRIWASAVDMIRTRPWDGFGPGTWAFAYPAHAQFDPGALVHHAHDDWLEWAVECGVWFPLAFAAFVLMIVLRRAISPWHIGVISVALHAVVDYPLQNYGISLWFMLLAAASWRATERQRQGRVVPVSP